MARGDSVLIMVKSKYFVLLLVMAGALYMLTSPPEMLSHTETQVASLTMMTICLWATGLIPEYITSLCFFLVAMLFSLAPASVVFAGFSSSAVWLIFAGLVLGVAISSTGLGKRTAGLVARHLHGSYIKIISGIVAAGVLFSFLMPSAMGRVVLLTPIATAMAEHFGFSKGSRGRTGVILAMIMGSFIPAFSILPANVPNMVLAGMADSQYQITLLYGPYLLLHFPVMGAAKALLTVLIILWLCPDTPAKESPDRADDASSALSYQEKVLAAVLLVLLLLWATDFLHHISPAWIGLAGAVFLLMPGISIVTTPLFNQKMNWASLIFVAGILGLGTLINHSGLGHSLAGAIIRFLPVEPGSDFMNYMSVSLAAAVTGIITTLPGVPAVFTPFSDTLARATGFSVDSILMMQVLGFSTVVFPYQAPPIVVGMQLSGEKFSMALKFCLIMMLFTLIVLFPIDFFWWKLMGFFSSSCVS